MNNVRRGLSAARLAGLVLAIGMLCRTASAAYPNIANVNGIGIAVDTVANAAYFVDYNGGTLNKIQLTVPACTATSTPPCAVTSLLSGFTHPEDVALDAAHHMAYVTTRDDPGTTGAFWRVDLNTNTRSLITFNLGAPQQIALDAAANSAYVVGYDSGRLWKIDLTTGSKETIVSGLGHPVGVVVTKDRTKAYVSEQTPARVRSVDLALKLASPTALAAGLTSPFFLSWTDPGEVSLLVVERDPKNDVLRIDIPTSLSSAVFTALPFRPSAIAVDWMRSIAYITTNNSVVSADMGTLPMTPEVFLGVGWVPKDKIDPATGLATVSNLHITATDAPFGGTIDIYGNFTNFKNKYGAKYYRVDVLPPGSATWAPLTNAWQTDWWNPITGHSEPKTLAPNAVAPPYAGNTLYEIPPEYPTNPERWFPPFIMMRWPTGTNGLYHFTVELFDAALTPITIVGDNSLALLVDNDPPQADVLNLYQAGSLTPVPACSIVQSPLVIPPAKSQFDVEFRAYDPNGHLASYNVWVIWGHNQSAGIKSEDYSTHVAAHTWSGVADAKTLYNGASCNCAYTFFAQAWKRTINGYWQIYWTEGFRAITVDNINPTSSTCP